MAKSRVEMDQRDALRNIIEYVAPDLATIVAMHEEGCYLRQSLELVLKQAELTRDELLQIWVGRAASDG
jgi:hypothetical protein